MSFSPFSSGMLHVTVVLRFITLINKFLFIVGKQDGVLIEYEPVRPTRDSARSTDPPASTQVGSGPPRSASSSGTAGSGSWLKSGTTMTSLGSSELGASVWIPPGKLKIEHKPDGKDWVLGEGSYGKVRRCPLD